MRTLTAVGLFNLALILLSGLAGRALAQEPPPHVPTEEEVRRANRETRDEDVRTYQRDSVDSVGYKASQAAAWVKEQLSGIHITPARLFLGLGLLGTLFVWNKNKKKVQWAVLSGFSILLLVVGTAAIILRWPYMN